MFINGVHYHVETAGSGEPLLLLHGFSGSGANWAEQSSALVERFRVVTPDLLGHGQTDAPADPARYRMEAAAADVIAICDALELPTIDLLGYSMGGRLALYVALTYPDRIRRLILESASPGLATAAERAARVAADEALAQRIEREGIPAFADYWTRLPLFATQSADVRARLYAQRLRNRGTGLANSLRGMGTGVQPSLWARLPELAAPTLLLAGALDTKFCAINQAIHEQLQGTILTIVADAGHTIHAEQPEAYRAALLHFLSL